MRLWPPALAILLVLAAGCGREAPNITNVRDAVDGASVTLKGRSGHIVEDVVADGTAFTLRDDFDDALTVLCERGPCRSEDNPPIMGITYYVAGAIGEVQGRKIVRADRIWRAYPPSNPVALVAGAAVGLLCIGYLAIRKIRRQPPAWGYLQVINGQEETREYPLVGDTIEIGREARGSNGVRCFQRDLSVSRIQGVILRKGNQIVYQNASQYGTTVGAQGLKGDDTAPLSHGTIIRMGSNNAILKVKLDSNIAGGTFTMLGDKTEFGADSKLAEAKTEDETRPSTSIGSSGVCPSNA